MTKYVCVKCHRTWSLENGDLDYGVSGGLCSGCLKDSLAALYRKKQLAEGNFDCFGKATTHCDQSQCKYIRTCLGKT
jgi:hypothetical protein